MHTSAAGQSVLEPREPPPLLPLRDGLELEAQVQPREPLERPARLEPPKRPPPPERDPPPKKRREPPPREPPPRKPPPPPRNPLRPIFAMQPD